MKLLCSEKFLIFIVWFLFAGCLAASEITVKSGDDLANILMEANEGDVVQIEAGIYKIDVPIITKNNITVKGIPFDKSNEDRSKIDDVVIIFNDSIIDNWNVEAGITMRGIKFIDGDHQIQVEGEIKISYCNFENGIDQVSFNRKGYGEVAYCTFYKSGDDGIDIDSKSNHNDAYFSIHHNYFDKNDQDGIEFRTHARVGGNILIYEFFDNIFFNCGIGEDGGDALQIIDQDMDEDSREILVYNNIINGNNVTHNGISCNDNKNSRAATNPKGATSMKEKIWIYNNTITNVLYGGIAGSNNTWAFNNIIMNSQKGLVHCTAENNLTYNVKVSSENVVEQGAKHYGIDPELNLETFKLIPKSYCYRKGISKYSSVGRTINLKDQGIKNNLGAIVD